jgi:hypothetical protein
MKWINLYNLIFENFSICLPTFNRAPPERTLVEDGYRTIAFPFEEITPPSFRMQAHWSLEQLVGYFSSWSATNRFIKSTGQNPLPPLADALGKVWAPVASLKTVSWPLSVRVGRL